MQFRHTILKKVRKCGEIAVFKQNRFDKLIVKVYTVNKLNSQRGKRYDS